MSVEGGSVGVEFVYHHLVVALQRQQEVELDGTWFILEAAGGVRLQQRQELIPATGGDFDRGDDRELRHVVVSIRRPLVGARMQCAVRRGMGRNAPPGHIAPQIVSISATVTSSRLVGGGCSLCPGGTEVRPKALRQGGVSALGPIHRGRHGGAVAPSPAHPVARGVALKTCPASDEQHRVRWSIAALSLVWTLASRNLFQDRLRFAATLIGIVFSVVLVMVQMGLYFGFGRMVTTMIDHAAADLWVVSKGASSFEDLTQLDIRTRDRLPGINGVASVIPVVIGFADWRRQADGRVKPVFVIGSDLNAGALVPWNLVEGNVDALRGSNAVAVDKTYFGDLDVSSIGSTAEIRGQPATVAAVTDGIRSFTTTPYVFADLGRARAYIGLPPTKFNRS